MNTEPEAFCQRTLAIYKSGVPMGTHCTYAWSGKMPCTGILRCTMCGKNMLMDLVQAYAESYVSVGNYMHAKRIKLEIDCLVSREVEDKSICLATVVQDHTILRNADHVMMSDTFARLELLNYRDGIEESMAQLNLRRDSLIQRMKCA